MTAAGAAPLPPAVVRRLASLGVRDPDPGVPLHRDLVDAVTRMGSANEGALNVALMWCYHAELVRQSEAYAQARTTYDRTLGRAVIRYRHEGERSAAVAEQRAHAEDDSVVEAHLAYRVAERMETAAREALRILHAANDNWRTQQANERKGDEFTARTGT